MSCSCSCICIWLSSRVSLRVTDECSVPEIAQYDPYYIPLNVSTASKVSNFYILLYSLIQSPMSQAGIFIRSDDTVGVQISIRNPIFVPYVILVIFSATIKR